MFDWRHLPVLHVMSFNAAELIDIGSSGRRVVLTKNAGTPDRRILFDLRTDESADGRGYRVATAPRVALDPVTGDARLVRCSRPRSGKKTVNRPRSGRKAQT